MNFYTVFSSQISKCHPQLPKVGRCWGKTSNNWLDFHRATFFQLWQRRDFVSLGQTSGLSLQKHQSAIKAFSKGALFELCGIVAALRPHPPVLCIDRDPSHHEVATKTLNFAMKIRVKPHRYFQIHTFQLVLLRFLNSKFFCSKILDQRVLRYFPGLETFRKF